MRREREIVTGTEKVTEMHMEEKERDRARERVPQRETEGKRDTDGRERER